MKKIIRNLKALHRLRIRSKKSAIADGCQQGAREREIKILRLCLCIYIYYDKYNFYILALLGVIWWLRLLFFRFNWKLNHSTSIVIDYFSKCGRNKTFQCDFRSVGNAMLAQYFKNISKWKWKLKHVMPVVYILYLNYIWIVLQAKKIINKTCMLYIYLYINILRLAL